MPRKYLPWVLGLLLLGGCRAPVQPNVDAWLCTRAGHPIDLQPPGQAGAAAQLPPDAGTSSAAAGQLASDSDSGIRLTSAQELGQPRPVPGGPIKTLEQRLTTPLSAVPGGQAPAVVLPDKKSPREQVEAAVKQYFPPLPPLGTEPGAVPGPNGEPLTLADLQKLALTNSPLIRQAASDVEAALGAATQAGAYPNPTIGYQASSQGPSGGPTVGGSIQQTIKTWGKLKLAQAAAEMDVENARYAYRRAETDLMTSVRTSYFAVLVALENIRANRALVELTDEVYRVMVGQLKAGEVATYEPLQLAVFAAQARAGLVTARNSYTLAWKQLAASLGLPAMPPTQVAGRIDMPLPLYCYGTALAHVLANHTDVKTAETTIQKARYNLRLAEVTAIPDLAVSGTLLNDLTPPGPSAVTGAISVTFPIPLWDLNKGAIRQAQGALLRATEEPHRVRDDLSGRLAEAFRRYDETRVLLDMYRQEILPKQVQTFRAAVKRHYGAEAQAVAYTDLVSAEQNLVTVVGSYLTILGLQWQAVVDVANLLQIDNIFDLAGQMHVEPVPDLQQLLALPCGHPCSPLPDPALKGANGCWPAAAIGPVRPAEAAPAPPAAQGQAESPPRKAVLLTPAGTDEAGAALLGPSLDDPAARSR